MQTFGLASRAFLSSLVLVSSAAAQPVERDYRSVIGEWYGEAKIAVDSGLPVNVILRVMEANGALQALMTLPESRQHNLELPSPYSDSAAVTFRDGRLRLEYTPDIGFNFLFNLGQNAHEGRIVLDVAPRGALLAGTLAITARTGSIELRRGPPPADYRREVVTFRSTADDLTLHGALIRPAQGTRHPVAVFITGSDPDARDVWLLEAAALARRGVASLLYDKRGVGASLGASHDLASWDDLAADVEGAVEYLRTRADVVDTAKIGLIGQSQGTWMIAKVASRNPHVAFVVNVSGGAMSGAEQETYRTSALMRRAGFPDSAIDRAVAFQRQKFAVARSGLGWETLDSVMQQLRRDSVPWFPGYGTGAAARTLAQLRLFGVLQFNYDPRPDLRKVRVPTLVLLGSNDVVFPPDTVARRMREVLADNPHLDIEIIPDGTHGMLRRQTAAGQAFRWAIDERFVTTLVSWVTRTTR